MLFLVAVLANDGVDHSFEDIVLWNNALHILDQVISIGGLLILEVIDDQVEACLWNDVDERWQDLECIFSASENNQVVSQKIAIL